MKRTAIILWVCQKCPENRNWSSEGRSVLTLNQNTSFSAKNLDLFSKITQYNRISKRNQTNSCCASQILQTVVTLAILLLTPVETIAKFKNRVLLKVNKVLRMLLDLVLNKYAKSYRLEQCWLKTLNRRWFKN